MKKILKIIIFLFFIFFVLKSDFAFALEINYPRIPGVEAPQDFINTAPKEQILGLYIKYFVHLIIWLSGILLLGSLIVGGVRYLTSAGNPEKIIAARQQISASFLGALILLSSVLILNILNPEIITLNFSELEPPKVLEKTKITPPATTTEFTRTSIDVELPLGPAIEDHLFSTSSRENIRINASTTLDIATKLRDQSNELVQEAQGCNCSQAYTRGCPVCPGCADPCTCDTCANQRAIIEELEEKNLQKIDELKEEQRISILLLKKLKIDLGRVERIEEFMNSCPLEKLASLASFLYNKDYYMNQKWFLRNVPFWKEIIVGDDWATFYCPVSGTILGEMAPIDVSKITEETPPTEPPTALNQAACPTKIPVGEIIDRTKRIANRLINRLETLIELDKEMIKAVDQLHVLVSECSSQKPHCCTLCILTIYGCKIVGCVNDSMWTSSIQIPEYGTCPYDSLLKQAKDISKIQKEIEIVVKEESEANIGIFPLVNRIIPNLLKDLRERVRTPMGECIKDVPATEEVEVSEQPYNNIVVCESAKRSSGEEQSVIQNCCFQETEFQNCLQSCYLKAAKDYEKCLNDCLKNTKNEEIAACIHKFNFFCCGM